MPAGVPSPQVQLYVYGDVPPDAVAVKLIVSPTWGFAGTNVKSAASSGVTGITFVSVSVRLGLAESVTVNVTVKSPAEL